MNVIICTVSNFSSAHQSMQTKIKTLIMHLNMLSFFIMINPTNVYNSVVKFLARSDINVNILLFEDVFKFHKQSYLVSCDLVAAAEFFHAYMKVFVDSLLYFDTDENNKQSGVFGRITGYYSYNEAQGQGLLHYYMLL